MSSGPLDESLDQCAGYLSQGDLFTRVPIVDLVASEELTPSVTFGPALLVNHDCALDKKRPKPHQTEPSIERLTFTRLRSMWALDATAASSLRGSWNRLQPYEALYLGNVAEFGESFVVMSDAFAVPVAYFDVTLREFRVGSENSVSLVARQHDTRFARLNPRQLTLLHDKWNAYWTRRASVP